MGHSLSRPSSVREEGARHEDGAIRIEFRCSPYHQNSALYPLIEHLQRVLHFAPGDTPQEKLGKLEQTLAVTIFT